MKMMTYISFVYGYIHILEIYFILLFIIQYKKYLKTKIYNYLFIKYSFCLKCRIKTNYMKIITKILPVVIATQDVVRV
jgi:hypothetical protein